MRISENDLSGSEIADFLDEHISDMKSVSPPESKHALDLKSLKKPDVSFWTIHDGNHLVGCGAVKELDRATGEIKSMRTASTHRGQGIASQLLVHMIEEARRRGYTALKLETGSMPFFEPARKLYRKFGFAECPPFSDYMEDPNSVFMTLDLVEPKIM